MSTKRKPAKPVTAADATSSATAGATAPAVVETSGPTSLVESSGAGASAALQTGAALEGELLPRDDQSSIDPPPAAEAPDAPEVSGQEPVGESFPAGSDTSRDDDAPAPSENPTPAPQPQASAQDQEHEQEQEQEQDDEPVEVLQATLCNHTPSQQVLRPLGVCLESGESLLYRFRDAAHEAACRKHIAELAGLHGWGEAEGLHWSAE